MWHIVLTIFLYCNALFTSAFCVEFNRNSTGVIFLPYVLNTTQEFTIYSMDELKTMLKVTSTKFSRVATVETANTGDYKENLTYHTTYSEVHTAEAAAILNREAISTNSSLNLSVYVGIKMRSGPDEMDTEIKLAFESVRKSNKIHPDTVRGVILSEWENDFSGNVTIANLALSEVPKIKQEAKVHNLPIGIKTYCDNYDYIVKTAENLLDPLEKARKQLLLQFDFIVCLRYAEDYYPYGITKTIDLVTENLVEIRDAIHQLNPYMEFMVETCMSEYGSTKKHFQYQLDFWTMMDQWGTRNNIPIWIHSALDNPWEVELYGKNAKYGWWRLKNDRALTDVDAYEEKVDQLLLPDPKSLDQESNVWAYIGVMIVIAIVIIVVAFVGVRWIRTNFIRRSVLTRREINGFMYGPLNDQRYSTGENGIIEMEALSRPYDKSNEIRKNSLQISYPKILGYGEFGVVYKASILESADKISNIVALKMTKDECPKTAVLSILSEIKILTYLGAHENIVSIKGAYTAEIEKGVVYVATELCELGSLKNYLRKTSKKDKIEKRPSQQSTEYTEQILNLEFTDLVQWSSEIACGMEYLAEKNVIHADLATRNVLLTADKTAKITDFGLSRRLYEYTNYVKKQQEPLPWRWMAIEALKKLEFSSQSDVWSYGVTLWEIFSMGDVPYPGLSWTLEFVDKLETGLRLKCPPLASTEIYVMMSTCWELEAQNRPTFTQLRQSFARMIENNRKDLDEQEIELSYK